MNANDIFNLTNAMRLRSSHRKTFEKSCIRRPSTPSINRSKRFDISNLEKLFEKQLEKNIRLKNSCRYLLGPAKTIGERKNLLKEFEKELSEDSVLLKKRYHLINSLEKLINKYSPPPMCEYGLSNNPNYSDESADFRAKMNKENEMLSSYVKYLEKKIIVMKMKLKLYHDQRDYATLKKNLNAFESGSSPVNEDEEIENKIKTQIKNIRTYMKYEKERIEKCKSPLFHQHDAACSIQSAWRGYAVRKKIKSAANAQLSDNHDCASNYKVDDNKNSDDKSKNDNNDNNTCSNTSEKNLD